MQLPLDPGDSGHYGGPPKCELVCTGPLRTFPHPPPPPPHGCSGSPFSIAPVKNLPFSGSSTSITSFLFSSAEAQGRAWGLLCRLHLHSRTEHSICIAGQNSDSGMYGWSGRNSAKETDSAFPWRLGVGVDGEIPLVLQIVG